MTQHNDQKPVALDSKDLTPEEFQSLCDVFETLLKWDREEKAKGKDKAKSKAVK